MRAIHIRCHMIRLSYMYIYVCIYIYIYIYIYIRSHFGSSDGKSVTLARPTLLGSQGGPAVARGLSVCLVSGSSGCVCCFGRWWSALWLACFLACWLCFRWPCFCFRTHPRGSGTVTVKSDPGFQVPAAPQAHIHCHVGSGLLCV